MKFITYIPKGIEVRLKTHRIRVNDRCVFCGVLHVIWADDRRYRRGLTDDELFKMVMDYGGPDAWQYKLDMRTWELA